MSSAINVSIVEDEAGVRRELEALINSARGFRCLKTYPNAETALQDIPQHAPDLVLMDINLPGMSGVECVRRLKVARPELPIVMLTVYEDSDALFKSLMAGANGYLVKRTPRPKLLEALREICAGGAPMSRSIARKVVEFFHKVSQLAPAVVQAPELQSLTPREKEILASLAKGHSYKEIATDLGISGDTTRKHMARIYEKLQVHSRTEAILKYFGR
ncbi:MAG: response regulator transcription factor [Chloroflexi bacterium]|nr:response regulator transcription factor [Chloroflexota bacterium]